MKLSQLIYPAEMDRKERPDGQHCTGDPEIAAIYYRSGDVQPGGIFFALKGQRADGHQYIGDALKKGAAAIVAVSGYSLPEEDKKGADAVFVFVKDTRKQLASASSRFFGNPSDLLCLIGISGTNGKTTTAYLIEHILKSNGLDAGVISTINYRYQGNVYPNPLTTPESLELQQILAQMAGAGVTHVVMEVSSHAVAMDRIYHTGFDMGIYTNLSQDHLDFHGSMEAYGACKRRFFTDYLFSGDNKKQAVAVINTDDAEGSALAEALKDFTLISVGTDALAAIRGENVNFDAHGMTGDLCFLNQKIPFQSGLAGRHNLENILCAAGAAHGLAIPPVAVAAAVASFSHVPGRLERIEDAYGRHVFVDYAHTPGALENVLNTLRAISSNRLICIFGCGGDRDRAKRPLMGEIATRFSDLVIITSDNPRTENPDAIIADIRAGVSGVEWTPARLTNGCLQKGFMVVPDRATAIDLGIRMATAGDIVLVAGKGHEDYQILGTTTIHFDDREKTREALAKEPVRNDHKKDRFWKLNEIIEATGGELISGPAGARFSGISIDSRKICADEVFVAVKGAIHDGHSFIPEVIEKGISGVVAGRDQFSRTLETSLPDHVACVLVDDTTRAFGDLAAFHRNRFDIPVVCVTGSNGKTTTKEMIARVLGEKYKTLKTEGNLNNEFGVPLTLFRLNGSHGAAVIELGMNHPGEICRLSGICRPDMGIITNIGPAHLEGLGDIENVMAAKGELIENIKKGGTIILNYDNVYCRRLGETADRKVMFFGESADADIRAVNIRADDQKMIFDLSLPRTTISVTLHAPGRFMVANALAAAAAGYMNGLSADQIKTGLGGFQPVKGRMDIKKSRYGFFIIDDTYNANPDSMEATISALVGMKRDKKGVLVAGDMLELGRQTELLHEHIGAVAAKAGVDRLFLAGRYAHFVKKGALREGMGENHIVIAGKTDLPELLKASLSAGDWVAVKGSRSTGMEDIVNLMMPETPDA